MPKVALSLLIRSGGFGWNKEKEEGRRRRRRRRRCRWKLICLRTEASIFGLARDSTTVEKSVIYFFLIQNFRTVGILQTCRNRSDQKKSGDFCLFLLLPTV